MVLRTFMRVTTRVLVDKAGRALLRAAASLVLLAVTGLPLAGQGPPPDEDWRTLDTPHFRVVFPADLESSGRLAAGYAEQAWKALTDVFVEPPSGRVNLLITDHTDVSNGFAQWRPYNRIVVWVRPPMEGMSIAFVDDWLANVVTHEVSHLFHMNRSGPVGSAVRRVFGRVTSNWPVFPNWGTPKWVVEGLATYYESLITGTGRVLGSFNEMTLRTAALGNRLERMDQISGTSPVWPSGNTRYVYGSMFLADLIEPDSTGEAKPARIGDFAEAVSRQLVPFAMNRAARKAFGTDFSNAYDAWTDSLASRARGLADSLATLAPITQVEMLTHDERGAFFPEVSPDGQRVAFVRSDGRSDVQLRWMSPDGSRGGKITRVNNRTDFDWTPAGDLVASQLESVDQYRIRSGLIRVGMDGSRNWIGSPSRVDQPSVSPDGRTAVAVQDGEGTNRLVRVELETGQVTQLTDFDPDVQWAYPEYSPDGRWIAVSRREPGALYDLWIATPDGKLITRITRDRAIDQAPAWSPDGKWIVWSSDRTGIPNLFAAAVGPEGQAGPLRQVTNVVTGVDYPSVSPDGQWIYASVYGTEGWDVGRLPFAPDDWFAPFAIDPKFVGPGPVGLERIAQDGPVRGYNPLPTLLPTFWELNYQQSVQRRGRTALRQGLGMSTSQTDLVGRHAYAVDALFRSSGRTDLGAAYTNRSLGDPTFTAAFNQFHSTDGPFVADRGMEAADTVFRAERERALTLGASTTRQRVTSRVGFSVSASYVWETRWLLDLDLGTSPLRLDRPDARFGELAATLTFSTARSQTFATTTTDGISGFVRARTRAQVSLPDSLTGIRGGDRGFKEVIGRVSAFRSISGPGFSNHSLAARGSFAHAWGPGADAFQFGIGGASGREEGTTGLGLFGGRPLFLPVRGYFTGQQTGSTAWSLSAEYRFPLWNVHRGLGVLPLHADRLSGAVFFDAGNSWGPEFPSLGEGPFLNPRRQALTSVGAELQGQFLLLFTSPLTVRVGMAHRFVALPGESFYLRVGTSF
jgi:WD40 repeat protein/surface antigen Omp85-like protein